MPYRTRERRIFLGRTSDSFLAPLRNLPIVNTPLTFLTKLKNAFTANYSEHMRALVQRVLNASVDAEVDGTTIRAGEIDKGLLVLLGITHTDTEVTAKKMAEKIWNLRIMEDENGVMNISIADSTKSILLISQFTLYGDTNAGRRPTWTAAAKPEYAEPLVNKVVTELQQLGAHVETGRFRTYMQVSSVNDGPTTVSIEI